MGLPIDESIETSTDYVTFTALLNINITFILHVFFAQSSVPQTGICTPL